MRKKSFKIISLSLALLLLASIIVPTALATQCLHVNMQISSEFIDEYLIFENSHQHRTGHYYTCKDCGAELFVALTLDEPEDHDMVSSIISQRHDSAHHLHQYVIKHRCTVCDRTIVETQVVPCMGPPCIIPDT